MKKLFLFGILFFSFFEGFSQTSFFFDKKGNKTVMRDDSIEIIVTDDRLTYAEPGKTWEKYIKFKDLDYAIVGPYYFKSFKLINSKGKPEKESAYFVVTETSTKKLLSYNYTLSNGNGNSTDFYFVYIVDNNNNIIDYVKRFCYAKSHLDLRKKAEAMIKKHFSDSPEFMGQFNQFLNSKDESMGILDFFSKPKYIKSN